MSARKSAISIVFRLIKKPEADLAFIRPIGFSHLLSFPWFKTVKICRTSVVLVVVYSLSSLVMA